MRYFATFYYFVYNSKFGTGTSLCANTKGEIVDDLFILKTVAAQRSVPSHAITLVTKVEITEDEYTRLSKLC
jgi:hypothetical protein